MRVLVSGDRNWDDEKIIRTILVGFASCDYETVVIEGDAKGADKIAGDWARGCESSPSNTYEDGMGLVTDACYPADWETYRKAAGPIRNKQMLVEGKPDIVLAFHDDLENSRGTGNMVNIASEVGIPVYNIRRIPPKSMAS